MSRVFALFVAVVLVGGPALAQDITGIYDTQGVNPGGGGTYSGQTVIERTGSTYRVRAEVGVYATGTGLFRNGVLAVMFPERGWIANYAVQSDGSLRGIWAESGGTVTGRETLTPRR